MIPKPYAQVDANESYAHCERDRCEPCEDVECTSTAVHQ